MAAPELNSSAPGQFRCSSLICTEIEADPRYVPSDTVPGPTATISPTQRDLHVLAVDEHGRMNWQKASGYNTRSKVEAAISRYKRVIGDTLKSRHDTRRATEVAIPSSPSTG